MKRTILLTLVIWAGSGATIVSAAEPPTTSNLQPQDVARITKADEVLAPFVALGLANESVVVRLPDDALRIFFVDGGTLISSITSTDGGLTWGPRHTELELPGKAYHALQVLLDTDGELHVVFHLFAKGNRGYRGRHYNLWHARTSGQRKTWSKPRQFFEGYVGALRSIVQLSSGRILVPFHRAAQSRPQGAIEGQPDLGWNETVVAYSDDNGDTWTLSPENLNVVQDPGRGVNRYGAIEPSVVELADGRIWMLIRNKSGRLYESFSTDGVQWTEPTPSRFISSDSPAAIVRMKDGRLVVLFNACQHWSNLRSYATGGRQVLHVAVSADQGKTWQGFREVLRQPLVLPGGGDKGTAYPAAVETGDGKILLVSGQGAGASIVLFDPDWLAETEARDDFSSGLSQWSIYGGNGIAIEPHPDRASASVLAIRRVEVRRGACPVWNFPAGIAGRIAIRLRAEANFAGASIALTDHFAASSDRGAEANAVYCLTLDDQGRFGKQGILSPDDWYEVVLQWSGDARPAEIFVDGRRIATLPTLRKPVNGLNYLRLRASGDEIGRGGLLVESVHAEVRP